MSGWNRVLPPSPRARVQGQSRGQRALARATVSREGCRTRGRGVIVLISQGGQERTWGGWRTAARRPDCEIVGLSGVIGLLGLGYPGS